MTTIKFRMCFSLHKRCTWNKGEHNVTISKSLLRKIHCCLEHAGMFLCQFGFMVLYNTALIKYLKNNHMLTSCAKFNDGIQKLL